MKIRIFVAVLGTMLRYGEVNCPTTLMTNVNNFMAEQEANGGKIHRVLQSSPKGYLVITVVYS